MSVPRFAPVSDHWDTVEQRSLLEHRWWTADELDTTDDTVYPREIGQVVRALLDGRVDEVMVLDPD